MSTPGLSRHGPVGAERGQRAVHEPRIERRQARPVDAEPLGHAAAIGLDHDVGARDEPLEHRPPLGPREIERHAALVAVDRHEHRALAAELGAVDGARGVATGRLLDLHDVGAHVGQIHAAGGAGDEVRQLEHAVAGERQRRHGGLLVVHRPWGWPAIRRSVSHGRLLAAGPAVSETADLLLRGARLPDRDGLADIAIIGERIVGVDTVAGRARETIELGGRLVTPGLVESHIHLDKALLTDRVASTAGTLEEALRLTGEAKRAFTVDDIRSRARRVLDLAVRAGTTAMRSHVEVDPHRRADRHGGDAAAARGVRAGARPAALRVRAGGHRAGAGHRGAAAPRAHDGRRPGRRLSLQRQRRPRAHPHRLRAGHRLRRGRRLPRRLRRRARAPARARDRRPHRARPAGRGAWSSAT